MGVLSQLITSLTQILSFGVGNSAVKYLAGFEGKERADREDVVISFSMKLAIYALVLSLVVALPVSLATFGSFDNLPYVAAASLAAPVAIVSLAFGAVLQARGPTALVAKAQIYSSIAAFTAGVPLICFGGTWGVVGALIATAIAPVFFLKKYVHLRCPIVEAAFKSTVSDSPLVRMGFALIGTIVIAQASAYLIRMVIVHQLGLVQAGYYQAAFSIAGNIPAFVFATMSTDFYPRVAAAKNGAEALEITERQIKAGVVLAAPFFVGLILFSAHLVQLLYSEKFLDALSLTRLMTWGVACRLVSWPFGYWLLARAAPKEVFWIEGLGSFSTMTLTLALIPWLGLAGAGIAFIFGALIYGVVVVIFARRKAGKALSVQSVTWPGVAAASLIVAQITSMQGLGLGGLTVAFIGISAPFFWEGWRSMVRE